LPLSSIYRFLLFAVIFHLPLSSFCRYLPFAKIRAKLLLFFDIRKKKYKKNWRRNVICAWRNVICAWRIAMGGALSKKNLVKSNR